MLEKKKKTLSKCYRKRKKHFLNDTENFLTSRLRVRLMHCGLILSIWNGLMRRRLLVRRMPENIIQRKKTLHTFFAFVVYVSTLLIPIILARFANLFTFVSNSALLVRKPFFQLNG